MDNTNYEEIGKKMMAGAALQGMIARLEEQCEEPRKTISQCNTEIRRIESLKAVKETAEAKLAELQGNIADKNKELDSIVKDLDTVGAKLPVFEKEQVRRK